MGSDEQALEQLKQQMKTLQSKERALKRLLEVEYILGATFDLRRLLSSIVSFAVELVEGEKGFLVLKEDEKDQLHVEAGYHLREEAVDSSFPLEHCVCAQAFRTGDPVIVSTSGHDSLKKFVAKEEHFRPIDRSDREFVCAPLKTQGRIIGMLIAVRGPEAAPFPKASVEMLELFAGQATVAVQNTRLLRQVASTTRSIIETSIRALEARDPYTRGHSDRVAAMCGEICRKLGLSEEDKETIINAAKLHDVGKIGIADAILRKSEALHEEEASAMKQHSLLGAKLLEATPFLRKEVPLVKHHHEHFDGSGYPDGLSGEHIPLGARIIAVADAFDAMISDRPYRKAMPREASLAELRRMGGNHLDPVIVNALIELETSPLATQRVE
ncbi:MAG: HD-GYP domain-containing protein [Candidatus Abyssubacteria bacterium]